MSLRKKPLRVLPNPWTFIHPDHGPQGHVHVDTGGRGSEPSYVGSEIDRERTKITEVRPEKDPRPHRQVTVFRFPALNDTLDGPSKDFADGIEVPRSPYYLDRLRDGDLVPADKATADAFPCRFSSLAEARAAGIAACDALHGPGAFAEAFAKFAPKTKSPTAGGSK